MASDPYNIEYPRDLPGNAYSPLGMNLMKNASYPSGWVSVDGWKHARQWISQKPGMGWGEGVPCLDHEKPPVQGTDWQSCQKCNPCHDLRVEAGKTFSDDDHLITGS